MSKVIPIKPLKRIVEASADIRVNQPEEIEFLHSLLCQVGMPRSRVEGRTFERRSGTASLLLEAGRIWHKGEWIEQPIPYGTKPRLVMVHLSSEAVRTQNRSIEVGKSARSFLNVLGVNASGGKEGGHTMFKKQMQALSACRMTLGISLPGREITMNTNPISRFEAWTQKDGAQEEWPGVIELSQEFYETLNDHAVPIDPRALAAIKHSALAIDIYTWLAHRLCRIDNKAGVRLSWANLREQFGQEYTDERNFKSEFKHALHQVKGVYPDAKIESTTGGFLIKSSPPPIPKVRIIMPQAPKLILAKSGE